jgi:signal transduction histidine kinase
VDREERLVEAQRHELISRATARFAHEVSNALQIIMTSVDMLQQHPDRSHPTLLADIRDAATHAAKLTRSLLIATRSAPAHQVPIDPVAFLRDMRQLLAQLVPGYPIAIDPDLATAPVIADPTELLQVLMNLVLNARDAMAPGAPIVIETRTRDDRVALTVRDQGSGIPPEVRPLVFEPFFTTKPPGLGSGLGLAIVDDIVRRHGGTIEIAENQPTGTAITVLLPKS